MTFKQLEALFWIAQLGGFAQAANRLSTSQSAVSKRVQELEEFFDTPLFDRSQRTARLTEKGEEMFVLARKLLEQRDAAIEQFSRHEVLERRLKLGVTELTAMTWLPRLIETIRTLYPKVVIEPTVDSSPQLRDKVIGDELDMAVVPDAFATNRLACTRVGHVDYGWLSKPGLVQRQGPLRLHELAQYRMLLQGQESGTGRIYDTWLQAQGAEPKDPIQVSNLVAMLGLVMSGLGVTYLPLQCLSPLIAGGMLSQVEVIPPLPPVNYVAIHRSEQRSTLVTAVVMLAQECCDFGVMFQGLHHALLPGHAPALT